MSVCVCDRERECVRECVCACVSVCVCVKRREKMNRILLLHIRFRGRRYEFVSFYFPGNAFEALKSGLRSKNGKLDKDLLH